VHTRIRSAHPTVPNGPLVANEAPLVYAKKHRGKKESRFSGRHPRISFMRSKENTVQMKRKERMCLAKLGRVVLHPKFGKCGAHTRAAVQVSHGPRPLPRARAGDGGWDVRRRAGAQRMFAFSRCAPAGNGERGRAEVYVSLLAGAGNSRARRCIYDLQSTARSSGLLYGRGPWKIPMQHRAVPFLYRRPTMTLAPLPTADDGSSA
jgi:hypothetical protein